MGLPGGQGRLRREAGQPQRRRGPADGRGGAEVRPGRPVGTQRRSMAHVQDAVAHVRSGRARQGGDGPRLDPPGTRSRIGKGQPGPVPDGRRLRHVARARPRPPVHEEPLPLQLALVLELGHRRAGQQRHPRRRRRPLGPGRRRPDRASARAAASTSSTTTRRCPTPRSSRGSSPRAALVWEHRMWSKHGTEGASFGIAFYGDKGTLIIDDKGWRVEDGEDGRRQADRGAGRPTSGTSSTASKTRKPPQRRHRGRPPQHPALPPGQHRPPPRPQAHLRRRQRVLPRRRPRRTSSSRGSTARGSRCPRRSEAENCRRHCSLPSRSRPTLVSADGHRGGELTAVVPLDAAGVSCGRQSSFGAVFPTTGRGRDALLAPLL